MSWRILYVYPWSDSKTIVNIYYTFLLLNLGTHLWRNDFFFFSIGYSFSAFFFFFDQEDQAFSRSSSFLLSDRYTISNHKSMEKIRNGWILRNKSSLLYLNKRQNVLIWLHAFPYSFKFSRGKLLPWLSCEREKSELDVSNIEILLPFDRTN